MAKGFRGFGSAPGLVADQGVEVNPDDIILAGEAQDRMAEDIQAMRERYVLPLTLEAITLNIPAAGNTVKIDRYTTTINAIIVSVITGTVNFWFGDFTSNAGSDPHIVFAAVGAPTQLTLAPSGYVFTLQAVGAAADVTLIIQAI